MKMNIAIFTLGFVGRYFAKKVRSPTIMWTTVIVSVPFFSVVSKVRLDKNDGLYGHRKTLEERLDFNPLTRNAYEKALEMNKEYQAGLKREILELETMLPRNK